MRFLRYFWFAALTTAIVWIATGWLAGVNALLTVIVLTLLETTFSADNAVINGRILASLSPLWQTIFMTAGIAVAVFGVRFALPIFMVMVTTHLGFGDVITLALQHPTAYAAALTIAQPFINAFGGTFLIMLSLSYFIDYQKSIHWLRWLEMRLGRLGQFDGITTFIMLVAAVTLYFSVPSDREAVLIASICALLVYSALNLVNAWLAKLHNKEKRKIKTGWAAFMSLLYLEVLDSAFSLDGVIGSFAITNQVVLIMAGLGVGAVWVRSLTAQLVRGDLLRKYTYLEHGAHWAIGFLGVVMLAELFGATFPKWFVGSIGVVCMTLAVASSRRLRVV